MRGPVDTPIELRILRKTKEEPFDVTLNRAVIKISPVRARLEGDIGYVRLTTFNEQTSTVMRNKLDELKRSNANGRLRGVVLDLRNNPGGLLDQAVAVADAFVDKGEIVSNQQVTNAVPALAAGTYTFFCEVHPNMQGTITAE